MPHKFVYNWQEIQEYYNESHSLRECRGKFGFGTTALAKAIKSGRLVTRTHEEACALKRKHAAVATDKKVSLTTWKGEVACSKFDVRALEKDVIVSKPNLECFYDRIADTNGQLYKVQIKYVGKCSSGVIPCDITRTCRFRNRKISYGEDEVDVIVVFCNELDKFYWLPKQIWLGKSSIDLRVKDTLNGQVYTHSHYASDFEW